MGDLCQQCEERSFEVAYTASIDARIEKNGLVLRSLDGVEARVDTYHLSCCSEDPQNWKSLDLAGVIFYSPCTLNDVRIKPGYVYLTDSKKLPPNPEGQVHGAAFAQLTGLNPSAVPQYLQTQGVPVKDAFVLYGGFARQNGEWKINSMTLNTGNSKWQDSKKEMSDSERDVLFAALEFWENGGEQNFAVRVCQKCGVIGLKNGKSRSWAKCKPYTLH